MLTGVAFGAAFLSSAPAIVLYFALPIAWAALGSIPFFNDAADWLDTTRTSDADDRARHERPRVGPVRARWASCCWLALPLAIGLYRISARAEIRAAL